jgi:hypothetical protein
MTMLVMYATVVDGGGGKMIPLIVLEGEYAAVMGDYVPDLAGLGSVSPCSKWMSQRCGLGAR